MRSKAFIIIIIIFLGLSSLNAQLKTFTFEEVEKLMISEPRTIVVFLQTDWCKYCKAMQKSTFKNEEVIQSLNDNFYFIPFDAEGKEPVTFRGHTFNYKPNGPNTGLHELAWQLGEIDGQIAYPTISVLNSSYEITFQNANLMRPKRMIKLLKKLQETP